MNGLTIDKHVYIHRVYHEERPTFCKVIVSVILNKTVMYMCPISNVFRDTAISLYSSHRPHKEATRHVLIRVAKCTDANGGIFENVLY
jgi:hypothetical protein